MMAVVRLDRRLHRRDVGGGGIFVLHRLQTMADVSHPMGAAGIRQKLIGRNRLLMIDRRRDVARHLRVCECALIMAAAVDGLSGITVMGLSQRQIFTRRRRRRDVAVMIGGGSIGDVVRRLE